MLTFYSVSMECLLLLSTSAVAMILCSVVRDPVGPSMMYQVRQKVIPQNNLLFSQQPLGNSVWNRDQLVIFACWKTFAPKHSRTVSLKQHDEHFVCCFTVTLCARIVHRQLLCMCSIIVCVKLLTALLIGSCGRLSQIAWNASLSSVIDLGFGWSLR